MEAAREISKVGMLVTLIHTLYSVYDNITQEDINFLYVAELWNILYFNHLICTKIGMDHYKKRPSIEWLIGTDDIQDTSRMITII